MNTTTALAVIPPPWETEIVPHSFEHAGLTCHVLRNFNKALCGYVKIPEGHPLFGVEYNQAVPESLEAVARAVEGGKLGKRSIVCLVIGGYSGDLIDVHGSVTFSGKIGEDSFLPKGFWWGFDCAHSRDFAPAYARLQSTKTHPNLWEGMIYRDLPYVIAECESMAEQLQAMTK